MVFHPTNVQPVNLYPLSVKFFTTSYVCELDAVVPLIVPLAALGLLLSYTIVYLFADHWAYWFTVAPADVVRFLTLAPFSYAVPEPFDNPFQPINVQPVKAYALSVKSTDLSYSASVSAIVPLTVPVAVLGLFALYAIVYVIA